MFPIFRHSLVILGCNLRRGFFIQQAEDHDGQQGQEEAGDDFVHAGIGEEVFPNEDGGAAHQDAGKGAVGGHAFPVQAQEHQGSKGGAKACPGVGHDGQDHAVGVQGQDNGENRHQDNHQAADLHHFPGFGVLPEHGLIKVSGKGRRGDQKLAAGGTHNGPQNAGGNDTGHKGVVELGAQFDEHGFGSGALKNGSQVHPAGKTYHYGHEQGDDHPGHGDVGGLLDFPGVLNGHKAHQDMGLAKVAKAPGQQGYNGGQAENAAVGALDQAEIVGADGVQPGNGGPHAAYVVDGGNGHNQHGEEHQKALEHIGPAHGGKAPHHCVEHHDAGGHHQAHGIVPAEDGFKQLAPGHKARGGVDQEKDEDKNGRRNPQFFLLVLKPVVKVLGQGNGVAQVLGENPQPFGHQFPVGPGAQNQPNGNPGCADAGQVRIPRQPHEHPAAHVGGLCAHGSHPGAQCPSPQGIPFHVVILFVGNQADTDQYGEVNDQCGDCTPGCFQNATSFLIV